MLDLQNYKTSGLVEKATFWGGMTETRLGIPAPMRDNSLSSIGPAFGGPKEFFNSPFSSTQNPLRRKSEIFHKFCLILTCQLRNL